MENCIRVQGARVNNLKNISVEIPRDKLVVLTGLSGSGKSSLAFDTIFAEGQRRYVESLSSYARMFLGQMDKPDVDSIDGLSPPSPSTRRPPAGIPARQSARSRKFMTICAFCGRAAARRTARSAARRSAARRSTRSSTRSWGCPTGQSSRFYPPSCAAKGRAPEGLRGCPAQRLRPRARRREFVRADGGYCARQE